MLATLSDLLEKKGHKVFAPTMTGLGERSHLLSKDVVLDTHIADIVNVIKWEDLRGICLVAHSYAAFPFRVPWSRCSIGSHQWSFSMPSFLRTGREASMSRRISAAKGPWKQSPKAEYFAPAQGGKHSMSTRRICAWVDSKLTAQPVGVALANRSSSLARVRRLRKRLTSAPRVYPQPAFNNYAGAQESGAPRGAHMRSTGAMT